MDTSGVVLRCLSAGWIGLGEVAMANLDGTEDDLDRWLRPFLDELEKRSGGPGHRCTCVA
jgi:hypothetical protein